MNTNRQKLEEMSDAEIDALFERRDRVKVHVIFRDLSRVNLNIHLSKDIYLAAVPVRGNYFEYEHGWGLHWIDERTSICITQDQVEISSTVTFSDDEIESLVSLGWRKR